MSKNQINFARNLRILRDMNEMSQQDLADQIHVARQTVSTWELGGGKPDIYLLCELCELFSIEPTKMLYELASVYIMSGDKIFCFFNRFIQLETFIFLCILDIGKPIKYTGNTRYITIR